MIEIKETDNQQEVYELYIQSFPEQERMDENKLFHDWQELESYSVYSNESFVGFIILLTYFEVSHILYFALKEEVQNRGIGTRVIQWVQKRKSDKKILADIEYPDNEMKLRRKQFYLKNGFHESDISYTWQTEKYEILVSNGECSKEEFGQFWKYFTTKKKK